MRAEHIFVTGNGVLRGLVLQEYAKHGLGEGSALVLATRDWGAASVVLVAGANSKFKSDSN